MIISGQNPEPPFFQAESAQRHGADITAPRRCVRNDAIFGWGSLKDLGRDRGLGASKAYAKEALDEEISVIARLHC